MKTILISGAGSGIGKATAMNLAQQGNTVFLLGRNKKKLEETFQSLPKGGHKILVADIRSREELNKEALLIKDVPIDGIIAASGLGGWSVWGDGDRWDDIIATNLTGTYNFVNTFFPNLSISKSSYKHVILITSALAHVGIPNYQALSASKAGLHGLMRCWSMDWASKNILVNAIAPGWVNTSMAHNDINAIANAYNMSRDEAIGMALQRVPLGKMAEPEDISEMIGNILTQRSMTGSIIDVNGGFVMAG